MEFTFKARGHPNVTSQHSSTFEVTMDLEIGKTADCIIGVSADSVMEDLPLQMKTALKNEKTIVIITELYDSNPGSSVTSWIDKLATGLIREFEIEPEKLILIEHNPDCKSSLEFFKETFDIVSFEWDGEKLINPSWKRITKAEVDNLLS